MYLYILLLLLYAGRYVVMMPKWLFSLILLYSLMYDIAFQHQLLAAAKLCHAHPTQQPTVKPPKERASSSNSASGWRVILPYRGCEKIPVFSYGSAVERPTPEGRRVDSNPTCSVFVVLVGGISYMGFGVPPYYRTALFGWVGVWRSSARVGRSGKGWP